MSIFGKKESTPAQGKYDTTNMKNLGGQRPDSSVSSVYAKVGKGGQETAYTNPDGSITIVKVDQRGNKSTSTVSSSSAHNFLEQNGFK